MFMRIHIIMFRVRAPVCGGSKALWALKAFNMDDIDNLVCIRLKHEEIKTASQ